VNREPSSEQLVQKVGELENIIAMLTHTIAGLNASKEYLDNIVNALDDAVFAKDEQHRWVLLNDASCQLMGHPREELIGKSDYDLFPKEQADVFWEKDDLVLRSGNNDINEEEITWRGKLHTISTKKSLYVDPVTEKKYIVGTIRDMTDQKKNSQALQESEARLKILFQFAPDAYYLNDLKGNFIEGNKAAAELIGYKKEELIGKNFLELNLLPPDEIHKAAATLEKNIHGKPTGPDEFTLVRKDGSRVIAEIRTFPVEIAGEMVVLGIARNITERKGTEKRLRMSEERYAMATQAAGVGVWDWNMQTDEFYFDPNLKAILGYSDAEIPSDFAAWVGFVYPDDRQPLMDAYQAHIDGKTPEFVNEHRKQHKDGSTRWIMARGTVIRDARDNPIRLVGTDTDITHRKQAEEALQKAHGELEQRVEQRTAELKALNQALYREIKERTQAEASLKESEERLKRFYHAAFEGMVITEHGKVIDFNRQIADLLGYEPDELLDKDVLDMVAEEDRELVLRNIRSGYDKPYEHKALKKDGSIIEVEVHGQQIQFQGRPARATAIHDLTERIRTETALRKRENELTAKATELEEANAALRVLLKKRDEDRKELEEKFLFNIQELVYPFLDRLKTTRLASKQKSYLAVVESNLNSLISPYGKAFPDGFLKLTPAELQVANFITRGKTTKEIADILNLSNKTIESHRKNIRKKIGIKNKKVNLRTQLLDYMDGTGSPTLISSSAVEDKSMNNK